MKALALTTPAQLSFHFVVYKAKKKKNKMRIQPISGHSP
jgi:hypothetical protein